MFVHPSRPRTQGAVFSTIALLALGACDDPVNKTDLRPDGAPEVLAVLVNNDPGLFFETATFCKPNDEKRPGLVAAGLSFELLQVCDEDLSKPAGSRVTDPDTMEETFVAGTVTDATPLGWYVRIMFDELIDPNVEELIPVLDSETMEPTGVFSGSLINTQPVILRCAPMGSTTFTEVAYDGYYSPSGNNVTWPLGPSLFIRPVDSSSVATSANCTVEVRDTVTDKGGIAVPADQRGPFEFSIAGLEFTGSAPAEAAPGEEEVITTDAPVVVSFNAFIDASTLDANEFEIREGAAGELDCAVVAATGALRAGAVTVDPADPQSLNIALSTGDWIADRLYAVTFLANEVADVAGGTGSIPEFTLCFLTEAP